MLYLIYSQKYNDTDKERNGETMETVLQVKGLSKQYKKGIYASHNVTFDVGKGEIFALIGPNGAGKTTTIRNDINTFAGNRGRRYRGRT